MARLRHLDLWPDAPADPAVQRANGVGSLQVVCRSEAARPDRATVGRLFQEGAAKIRFSAAHADPGLTAALINTAGGLTGGDRLVWRVDLDEGAKCSVVTQACEKVYRSDGGAATVSAALTLGRGARLDWLPQETILFDGARLTRTFDIRVAAGARLLAVEAVLLGRRAMGEYKPFVHLHDRWRVWNDEGLVFADDVRLDPSPVPGAALLNGAGAYATVLYVADDYGERVSPVRALLEAGRDHVFGGASAFKGKLFCRLLARDGLALRRVLIPVLEALRDGEPLSRLWTI